MERINVRSNFFNKHFKASILLRIERKGVAMATGIRIKKDTWKEWFPKAERDERDEICQVEA